MRSCRTLFAGGWTALRAAEVAVAGRALLSSVGRLLDAAGRSLTSRPTGKSKFGWDGCDGTAGRHRRRGPRTATAAMTAAAGASGWCNFPRDPV